MEDDVSDHTDKPEPEVEPSNGLLPRRSYQRVVEGSVEPNHQDRLANASRKQMERLRKNIQA